MLGASVTAANAEPLPELIPDLLNNHDLFRAAEADANAASESIETAMGGYYPTLDMTGTYGNEQQLKPDAADTSLVSREMDFIVTQRIWDFGVTKASVDTAKLEHEKTLAALTTQRSILLQNAFVAYVNILRGSKILEFAIQSEENIKEQTELEDSKVKSGAGLTTDVLQAKRELAGAMARRVKAEGDLEIAKNVYRGVFLKDIGSIKDMVSPVVMQETLPVNVEDAIARSMKSSPRLISSNLDSLVSRETVKSTYATSYRPTIDGIFDYKLKKDVGSTIGTQDEMFAKVQVNFPFNLGMTATNTLKATELAENAATYRYASAINQVEEFTRTAWQRLKTARDRTQLLKNQADIAAEFLELARKEQQLGNRSLLDVLSGETALINAQSDAVSSETDVSIAAIALLDIMGELDENAFK